MITVNDWPKLLIAFAFFEAILVNFGGRPSIAVGIFHLVTGAVLAWRYLAK